MKKRMWIGVLFLFLQELVSLIISNQIIHTTLACEFYDEQKNVCFIHQVQFVTSV